MKLLFLAVIFLMSTNLVLSQEKEKPTIESKIVKIPLEGKEKSRTTVTLPAVQNKSVTISKKAGEAQRVHDASYYQEEIAKIDNQISSINTKIQLVQNDPQENTLAEHNNWYAQMDEIKNQLLAKKNLYLVKLNQ